MSNVGYGLLSLKGVVSLCLSFRQGTNMFGNFKVGKHREAERCCCCCLVAEDKLESIAAIQTTR